MSKSTGRFHPAFMALGFGLILLSGVASGAPEAGLPLAPPDTSSPRAAIATFLDTMNQAVKAFQKSDPPQANEYMSRAMQCLNLESEPPALRYVMGFTSAMYLKEVLDRIEIPPLDEIPDASLVASRKLISWTIPHTEITLGMVKDAAGTERFLFSPTTIKNSEAFYDKVKPLPYKPGAVGALYQEIGASAGLNVPRWIVESLPHWAKTTVYGQALWQWTGLLLFIILGITSAATLHRQARRLFAAMDGKWGPLLQRTAGDLILPASLAILGRLGLWFMVYELHFISADTYLPIAFIFMAVSDLGVVLMIVLILNPVADFVNVVVGFESGSMQAQLVRFCFDVLIVVIAIAAIITLGGRLGLPTYSLVTGLGIGGLAVALGGREALSNLIATFAILLDQPFKLGDFVVLGDQARGTVIEIGLRSTRIKTRDGILVSIPNSTVADMKIINESAPVAEARIRIPVGAAYGSSPEEVERAMRAACDSCEYVTRTPAPSVRLAQFGDSALEFELLVWIIQPEFRGRATDQLNRAILAEFGKLGIEMPFPQREIHISTD